MARSQRRIYLSELFFGLSIPTPLLLYFSDVIVIVDCDSLSLSLSLLLRYT